MDVVIVARPIVLRSAEPPSWIQLFAEAPWWVQALSAYAAVYVAEIVKGAGKETWQNRAKIASTVAGTMNRIARFAFSLIKLKSAAKARTKLVLGLPVPDDHFGVRFELIGQDEDVLATEIALFVNYIPAIEQLIEAEGLSEGQVTGAIILVVTDDASLRVTWMDRECLEVQERLLRLEEEA